MEEASRNKCLDLAFNTQSKTIHIQRKRLVISWMDNGPAASVRLLTWCGEQLLFDCTGWGFDLSLSKSSLNWMQLCLILWFDVPLGESFLVFQSLKCTFFQFMCWKSYIDLYISSKGFCRVFVFFPIPLWLHLFDLNGCFGLCWMILVACLNIIGKCSVNKYVNSMI